MSFQRKSKGDVDYSDIAKIRPWDTDDSSYFEDNSSQTLLVSFAGHGWKQSPPTFIFYNFLSQYKDVDKLFLRDLSCRYYLLGLKGLSASLQETVSYLNHFTEKVVTKKLYFWVVLRVDSQHSYTVKLLDVITVLPFLLKLS